MLIKAISGLLERAMGLHPNAVLTISMKTMGVRSRLEQQKKTLPGLLFRAGDGISRSAAEIPIGKPTTFSFQNKKTTPKWGCLERAMGVRSLPELIKKTTPKCDCFTAGDGVC